MKLSERQLKYLKSLHQRKYRQKYHNFIAEGTKIAGEVLAAGSLEVEGIFAVPGWLDANNGLWQAFSECVTPVQPQELDKISLLATPNRVLLVLKQPPLFYEKNEVQNGLSLYLDDIRDPGNFGSMLRIADWFGIRHVFCSPDSVEIFHPKVVQAGMGAFLRVRCLEMDFLELKSALPPSMPIYGAVLDGASLFSVPLSQPALLVVGNESRGVSPAISSLLSHKISIPKGPGGGAESLNAAVAAGILCAAFLSP